MIGIVIPAHNEATRIGAVSMPPRSQAVTQVCLANPSRFWLSLTIAPMAPEQLLQKAGGFASIACSEDVALVEALQATGARIAWSADPRVTTSARIDARARGGFGDTLIRVVSDRSTQHVLSLDTNGLD